MRGQTMIKTVSVIMVIGSLVGLGTAVFGLVTVSGYESGSVIMELLCFEAVLALYELITAVMGLLNCGKITSSGKLIVLGTVLLILEIADSAAAGMITKSMGVANAGPANILVSILLPALYVAGALLLGRNRQK